jgi:tetratricopeptide (TPR) repeat protein
MNNDPRAFFLKVVSQLCLLMLPFSILAQEASKTSEGLSLESQRRAFAISIVISLADETRKYDGALRPRVLARAADILWNADSDTARTLFRRAWEAAEKGDAEGLTFKNPDGVPAMAAELVTALRRENGYDLRAEVLALAARCDQKLGEEFLKKLTQDKKEQKAGSSYQNSNDNSEDSLRRLNVATRLLDEGDIERALEFAAPALNQVTANSIGFLSKLREKRSGVADQRFALLLAQAELDPSSDANTVSGLSSYAFTPGFYVTFNRDGNARWIQPEQSTSALRPPQLPALILNKFFQVGTTILLRPLPPPNQDFTTSGRIGKSMVIKRLLPLFEQHSPDAALALRTQLQALSTGPRSELNDESPLLKQGFQTDVTGSSVESMQERIDHAKSSRERDRIYADAAVTLASRSDNRAQEFAQKIEDPDRRAQVLRYVDFELVRFALLEKKFSQAIRLAASEHLSHSQRSWAFMQAARLIMDSGPQGALELLEKAANEAGRIEAEDPNRTRLLIGVASQIFSVDRVRAWEIMGEVVKAANNSEKFNGDNVELHFPFATKSGLRIISVGGADFGLSGALRSLAKDDLYRSIDLAKEFKNDALRAIALLAVASSLLEKVDTPLR